MELGGCEREREKMKGLEMGICMAVDLHRNKESWLNDLEKEREKNKH